MKELDCIELTVEKDIYIKEGVYKGMQGWICLEESIDGTWMVEFPQWGEKPPIAMLPVYEKDMKEIEQMDPRVNERIKAEHEWLRGK